MDPSWTQEQQRRLQMLCPDAVFFQQQQHQQQLLQQQQQQLRMLAVPLADADSFKPLPRSASSPCLSRRNSGRPRSRSFSRDLSALGAGGGGGNPGAGARTRLQSRKLQEQQKRKQEEEKWQAQACEESAMEQALPDDVLELCLVRLPWRCLVRMRLVCKRWRALLLSRPFLRLRAVSGFHEPWMFIFKPESQNSEAAILAYDPVYKKSHFIRAPAMAGRSHYSLVAGGGLVYLVGGGGGGSGGCSSASALAYNPVTNAWRKMPPMHHGRDSPAVGVVEDKEGRTRLLVAGGKGLSRRSLCSAELYDPATNRWNYITSLPPPFKEVRYGAVHNGKLLVYNRRLNLTNEVAAYDMDRGVWTRLPMTHSPGAPPKYHHFHLMSCGGKLFKVEDGPHMKEDTSISVWRLEEARMEWVEVAKIPPLDKGTWLWYIGSVEGKDGQCLIYLYEVNYPNLMSIRCCVCDLRTGKAHWQWITDMPYMVHPNDLTAIVQL